MQRTTVAALTGLLAVAFVSVPAAAEDERLDRIDLPDGWTPEGITTDGVSLFAGSLADGAIWRVDPSSGEGDLLVPGMDGTVAAGIEHDAFGRLWAAGAPTGEVRAYDAATGALLATYPFEGGFLNDLAATPEAVYITDSFVPQILVIPLGSDGELPDPSATMILPISGELEYGEGFNVNGIVATSAGLVVVHSGTGQLYRIDPATGVAARIDSGDVDLTTGDTIEKDEDTLYVMRNRAGLVVALELDETVSTATLVEEQTSDDFDVPTTIALLGDDLWAVNARFGTDATPQTEYWITRVDAVGRTDD